MITEDYVSFETAKLLKEKGFDWDCKQVYDLVRPQSCFDGKIYDNFPDKNPNAYDELVSAPTLQMAMKWLRKEHNIHIAVIVAYNHIPRRYEAHIMKLENIDDFILHQQVDFTSYEEACEAAIKYYLENLI